RGTGRARRGAATLPRMGGRLGQRQDGRDVDRTGLGDTAGDGDAEGSLMRHERSADQEFFRATTARFLAELAPVDELRRRRDDAVGFDPDYWKRGAELGWTSLLVSEENGGGSISG